MSEVKLNLARKWRSKNFEEIVGQDISIRMLKNSLFLQQYFPVYLFSGQRGCGKTSTARVFAAAINCEQLESFRKDPKHHSLPCLVCPSCKAIEQGKHPDFIEIDAASHTGVDHVRMLIDSASLLPLMGSKKIYLIDEAHMLSKAAFNALLKILEEPPASVIFMLATTDSQKIIETVRSRCFQLFFKSVNQDVLLKQLEYVCGHENIAYDQAGLLHIIRQTDGSVRDALNILETVRFSSKSITKQSVSLVLGHLDDSHIIDLCLLALQGDVSGIFKSIHSLVWHQYNASVIWQRLSDLIRALLWWKHGVEPDQFIEHRQSVQPILKKLSVADLVLCLKLIYEKELLFSKSTAKHELIEMVLIETASKIKKNGSDDGNSSSMQPDPGAELSQAVLEKVEDEESEEEDESDNEESVSWRRFVASVETLQDPLINSLFLQAVFKKFDADSLTVHVEFSKDLIFFEEWLEKTRNLWIPLLHRVFGSGSLINSLFTGAAQDIKKKSVEKVDRLPVVKPQKAASVQKEVSVERPQFKRSFQRGSEAPLFANEKSIDTSNADMWPMAHIIKKHFSSSVTEIRE